MKKKFKFFGACKESTILVDVWNRDAQFVNVLLAHLESHNIHPIVCVSFSDRFQILENLNFHSTLLTKSRRGGTFFKSFVAPFLALAIIFWARCRGCRSAFFTSSLRMAYIDLALIIFAKMLGYKTTLLVHKPYPEFPSKPVFVLRCLYRALYLSAGRVVCMSNSAKKLIHKDLSRRIKVSIVKHPSFKNFVKHQEELFSYSEIFAPSSEPYLALVSNMRPENGLVPFLQFINGVDEPLLEHKFLIGGKFANKAIEGVQMVDLRSEITINVGAYSYHTLFNTVRRAQAVVCPYLDATQSGVVPLALSLGVPVLLSDIPALKEYSDIPSVFYFEIGNETSYVRAVNDLMAQKGMRSAQDIIDDAHIYFSDKTLLKYFHA